VFSKQKSRQNRFVKVAFPVFLVFGATLVAFTFNLPSKKPAIENLAGLPPFKLKRIKTLIGVLRKESLDGSLRKMGQDLGGFAVAYHARNFEQPSDFVLMLSSRRTSKLLQEYASLSEFERNRVLPSNLESMIFAQEKHVYSLVAGSAKEDAPYVNRKFGITLLLFAIAEFGSTKDLGKYLDTLAIIQQNVRNKCDVMGVTNRYSVSHLVEDPFPCDLTVLNVMLHHLLKKGSYSSAIAGLKHGMFLIVKFDAPANTFDLDLAPPINAGLPSSIPKQDVLKEIEVFTWDYPLCQPDNLEDTLKGGDPSFKHQKTRLEYVRSLLLSISS
jgi:hypothetical protein